ncbi:putative phosphoglycerate mutase [Colletotrichum godetiae]|uniref:Phosphoglycerate mutase n=1 Tax=Colletotrichum godetiae TaxID=1209918 RepID=A0AAJ0EMD5_9PEZI|nr:putative phosphoglycerate mutase [Colletotrichum godetiae]KAK1657346.1 putative phosphoglycerate mutase [Colletotrichum godetiae]
MPDQNNSTPRVICVRHGETKWSREGRFTGDTEIDLTAWGADEVSHAGKIYVGRGKLIDPARLVKVIVSPRIRAKHTLEKLLPTPPRPSSNDVNLESKTITTEDIAEWNYGDYEGLTDDKIRSQRRQQELDQEDDWNIWRDGCEGGESKQQVTERLDRLITQICKMQEPHIQGEGHGDVLVVAHGLILRCFWKRWNGFELDQDILLDLPTAGMFVLRFVNTECAIVSVL